MIDPGKTTIQALNGAAIKSPNAVRQQKEKTPPGQAESDSFASTVSYAHQGNPRYPLMTIKLFGALDQIDEAVKGLSTHPTQQQVADAKLRNMARWVQVLSDAYADSYDDKDLKKAQAPIHELAEIAGHYKDADLVETEMRALYRNGKVPAPMEKDLAKLKKKRAEEFHDFFKEFKHKKLERSLEILKNPDPIDGEMSPAGISRQDRRQLGAEVSRLIDRIGEVGLFHDDSETLHDGRKSMRNLYALIYVTGDVFDYDRKDVDSLFKLFTRYGEPQDKHIAQMWAEKEGYDKESKFLQKKEKELQQAAMLDAAIFLKSGALEHIRETVNRSL